LEDLLACDVTVAVAVERLDKPLLARLMGWDEMR
jgi:hypothetical protein